MENKEVASVSWAFATIGHELRTETLVALEAATRRVAPFMENKEVASVSWAFATTGHELRTKTLVALEDAAARIGMSPMTEVDISYPWALRGALPAKYTYVKPGVAIEKTYEEVWPEAGDKGRGSTRATGVHPDMDELSSRWLSSLPNGARSKLEQKIFAAQTPDAKWQLVVDSAEADNTRVRATQRQEVKEAEFGRLATPGTYD
jgi:hypothetical protein